MADIATGVVVASAHTLDVTARQGQNVAVALASAHVLSVTPGTVGPGLAVLASADGLTVVTVRFAAGSWTTADYATRAAVYDVIGRPAPVVVSDVRGARAGSFTLVTTTADDAAELLALFTPGTVLRFVTHPEPDYAGMWFAAARVSRSTVSGRFGSPHRLLAVDYIEVDPAPAATFFPT